MSASSLFCEDLRVWVFLVSLVVVVSQGILGQTLSSSSRTIRDDDRSCCRLRTEWSVREDHRCNRSGNQSSITSAVLSFRTSYSTYKLANEAQWCTGIVLHDVLRSCCAITSDGGVETSGNAGGVTH